MGPFSYDSGRWLEDYVMILSSNPGASGYNNLSVVLASGL